MILKKLSKTLINISIIYGALASTSAAALAETLRNRHSHFQNSWLPRARMQWGLGGNRRSKISLN